MQMPKLKPFRVHRRICLPSSLVYCTPVCWAPTRVGVPAEQGPPPIGAAKWSPPQLEIVLGHTCMEGARRDRMTSGRQPLPTWVHLLPRQPWHMCKFSTLHGPTCFLSTCYRHFSDFINLKQINLPPYWWSSLCYGTLATACYHTGIKVSIIGMTCNKWAAIIARIYVRFTLCRSSS